MNPKPSKCPTRLCSYINYLKLANLAASKEKNADRKFMHYVTAASESLRLETEVCNGNCNSFLTMPVHAFCSNMYGKKL